MKTVNPLHQSDQLHRDAGTYYSRSYEDAARIFSLFDSFSWANQLLLDDALDAAKLFVRTLISPVHRQRFLTIRVDEQTYREGRKKLLLYGGENIRYGDALYYGHPATDVPGAVELPPGVLDVDLCCDLPVDPGIVLVKNVHFFIRGGCLFFHEDLFDAMPVSDGSVTIHLRGVTVDRHHIQDRLGVLLRTRGESTQKFLDFNNLVLDCVMEGTSYHRLSRLVCALYDIPCTRETETVERIGFDENRSTGTVRFLATDRRVYFAPLAARFLYEPGDTIQAGTILTDAIQSLRGAKLPENTPILFERRFLGHDYQAGLLFPNEDVPLTIEKGNSYPTFQIAGRNDDIRRFWQTFYSRTEDRAILSKAATGSMINPAKFVYANVLYPRAQFYFVHHDRCGPDRLATVNTRIFRNLLPPGVLFSLIISGTGPTHRLELPHITSLRTGMSVAAETVTGAISIKAVKLTITMT